ELVEENIHGMFETVTQRQSHATKNGFLRHGKHRPRVAVDSVHEVVDGLLELRFRDEAIDHAQLQRALGSHRFAAQNEFQCALGSYKKRQNRGSERWKNTNDDFRLGKARFGGGNDQITESRQFRAAADGGPIHDANHGLADFEHSCECGVEGVEHLKNALRGVLADVHAATKDFAGGIEHNQFHIVPLSGRAYSVGHFAQHCLVEKIVIRAVEGHSRDATVKTQLHVLKLVGRTLRGLR